MGSSPISGIVKICYEMRIQPEYLDEQVFPAIVFLFVNLQDPLPSCALILFVYIQNAPQSKPK